MGSRGSTSVSAGRLYSSQLSQSSGAQSASVQSAPSQQQAQPQNIAQQAPNAQNTTVTANALNAISSMSDSQLANLVNQAQTAQLPNFLSDRDDLTQKFVYVAGLNEKPMVLDDTQFNQFLKDNNIPKSQILSRSMDDSSYTNAGGNTVKYKASQLFDMLKYSRLNYIGGKMGGKAYGAGTYLDRTGGNQRTGYGSVTNDAVLNPKTAKVISKSNLLTQASRFASSHPQFARAVGSFSMRTNGSIYALAMGYNVIRSDHSGYHNVIDRSALVWKKNSY